MVTKETKLLIVNILKCFEFDLVLVGFAQSWLSIPTQNNSPFQ